MIELRTNIEITQEAIYKWALSGPYLFKKREHNMIKLYLRDIEIK